MATGDNVGRRDFLRKAAAVGTGAFAVPMIVTVEPADAQAITSPPPERPGRPEQPGSQAQRGAPGMAAPPGRGAGKRPAKPQEAPVGQLPLTGMTLDSLAKAGLAATAGGAALVLWSAKAGPKAEGLTIPDSTDPTT